ncbi:MAG: hypothetical protein AAF329_07225 [Cyanobacteria bacterium P01_A01_bin.17]
MLTELSINDISALLMVLFTCVITVANILLWLATRRTIALQVKSNYSVNHQTIVHGHRDLFLGLLHHPNILKKFAEANAMDVDEWEFKIIAALFINQTFVHFLNFANGTIDDSYMEGFIKDAQEIFSLPTVKKHWQHSKQGYSDDFQKFVEQKLMPIAAEDGKVTTHPALKA